MRIKDGSGIRFAEENRQTREDVALPLTCIKAAVWRLSDTAGMATIALFTPATPGLGWKNVVLPKEHGSWSLAFEPLTLGLLVAPSLAGGWIALSVLAAFFSRRPLKIALRDKSAARRGAAVRALLICAVVGLLGFSGAILTGGVQWMPWALPFAAAGAVFLAFDLRNGGREEVAEIAGAAAFSLVPAAIAAAAGWTPLASAALFVAMAGRSVPAVMFVRACVRGGKTGVYRAGPALLVGALALSAGALVALAGVASVVVPLALAVFLGRTAIRLLRPAPIRARTLGFQELGLGVAYVVTVAATWPR